jgi:hypothetical protein
MNMHAIDDEVCGACLPATQLAWLASLRTEPTLRIARRDDLVWLRWAPGRMEVVRALLPLAGVRLYVHREPHWLRFGAALPAWEFPDTLEFQPLDRVLFPAPMTAIPAPTTQVQACRLGVQTDDEPRATTALFCPVEAMRDWAETVPAVQVRTLRAASHGTTLIVLGDVLPLLPAGVRYWGKRLLVPLGLRPDPDLPERILVEAAGLDDDEILLHRDDRWEAVPTGLFEPLTLAGLRMLAGGRR